MISSKKCDVRSQFISQIVPCRCLAEISFLIDNYSGNDEKLDSPEEIKKRIIQIQGSIDDGYRYTGVILYKDSGKTKTCFFSCNLNDLPDENPNQWPLDFPQCN